jgi:hypothetical protein
MQHAATRLLIPVPFARVRSAVGAITAFADVRGFKCVDPSVTFGFYVKAGW